MVSASFRRIEVVVSVFFAFLWVGGLGKRETCEVLLPVLCSIEIRKCPVVSLAGVESPLRTTEG